MEPANGLIAFFVAYFLFIAVIGVFLLVCHWIIYTKAGQPGWAVIIPIYNFIIMQRIIGKPWWWLFLVCIPLVNIVFVIMIINGLSKSFGKDAGFTVGLIFLPFIFYPILAFGSAKYIGPDGVPANSGMAPQV